MHTNWHILQTDGVQIGLLTSLLVRILTHNLYTIIPYSTCYLFHSVDDAWWEPSSIPTEGAIGVCRVGIIYTITRAGWYNRIRVLAAVAPPEAITRNGITAYIRHITIKSFKNNTYMRTHMYTKSRASRAWLTLIACFLGGVIEFQCAPRIVACVRARVHPYEIDSVSIT